MHLRKTALLLGVGTVAMGSLWVGSLWAQLPWREYPAIEYNSFPAPPDAAERTEWVFGRLMYPPSPYARFDRAGRNWARGMSSWTQDYPRADRHFLTAVRRLTRIHARSVEQPVNLDDGDDVFNWPFLYAVRPGEWNLTDEQAHKLGDYLARGGFFMADDFWGTQEWQVFMASLGRALPGRQAVDLENANAIFHTVYDLDDRYRVPGSWGLRGRPYQNDGDTPYWRGVYDDKGRLQVAIVQNSDLGDSWEFADDPYYPEKYSALGIRIGVNYAMYAFTH